MDKFSLVKLSKNDVNVGQDRSLACTFVALKLHLSMEVEEKEIEYYETKNGQRPFRDWFLSLKDKLARNKIDARIRRVELGSLGFCNSVGEGVLELKIDFGPGFRIYFGQAGTKLVILLTGGDKSSQQKDIKTAQKYWKDYRRRNG